MGGAGFPTGLKWEIVRNTPGDAKYVVCNADESEPGTFKDRFILDESPHLVIEGMMLAGLVTGARQGILYIRHEYEAQIEIVEHEIATAASAAGLIGRQHPRLRPAPSSWRSSSAPAATSAARRPRCWRRWRASAPSRATSRRSPARTACGGKPTVINNVETFADGPGDPDPRRRVVQGSGPERRARLKFVGISGDVARPASTKSRWASRPAEVIFDYAGGVARGQSAQGVRAVGPLVAASCRASLLDMPLDFKSLADARAPCSAPAPSWSATTGRCMLDMALNAVRFFRNESCGKCVPCRVGSQKLVELLAGWRAARARAAATSS